MVDAVIGLGSNRGDRHRFIRRAVEELSRIGTVVAVSSLYETAPIGGPDQDPYLNAAAVVDTDLTPAGVVAECLAIERSLGRERGERWGPRTIDLDLLLYGDVSQDTADVTVPHPRLEERRFALEPIVEMLPDARLPDGRRLADLLAGVSDQHVVRLAEADRLAPGTAVAVFLVTGILGALIWIGLGYFL